MRTWSLEETIIRAQSAVAVAAQGVWDMFTHRPAYANDHPIPGCPSPSDCRGFGCAGDCSEASEAPGYDDGEGCTEPSGDLVCPFCLSPDCRDPECRDEPPNPYEPGLTDSELVGLRGLLQERYGDSAVGRPNPLAPVTIPPQGFGLGRCPNQGSMCNCTGACMRPPNLSPAVSAAGTSPAGVSVTPQTPPAGRSDPSRGNRLASVRGEGPGSDSGIRTSPEPGHPELDWHGWAVPAICEVLAEHAHQDSTIGPCSCRERPVMYDRQEWREHVAPLIASRLACDPARAIAALHNHKPQ